MCHTMQRDAFARARACRLFTGVKSASHDKVRWVVKGSASMRECLDAALQSAPCAVEVKERTSLTKATCIKLYNEDVIRQHDGAPAAWQHMHMQAGADRLCGLTPDFDTSMKRCVVLRNRLLQGASSCLRRTADVCLAEQGSCDNGSSRRTSATTSCSPTSEGLQAELAGHAPC